MCIYIYMKIQLHINIHVNINKTYHMHFEHCSFGVKVRFYRLFLNPRPSWKSTTWALMSWTTRAPMCYTGSWAKQKKTYRDMDGREFLEKNLKWLHYVAYRLLLGEKLTLPLSKPLVVCFLYRHRWCSPICFCEHRPKGWYGSLTVTISWQGKSFEHYPPEV